MNDITELMRRATDDLETDSNAESILRRSIDNGVRQRRRRTAGICLASASALVLTGAATVAVQQAGTPGPDSGPPVAGTPSPNPSAGKPATSRDTLATLQAVLPAGLRATAARHWENNPGWHGATVIVDDGHGAGRVTVMVSWSTTRQCQPDTAGIRCRVLPDGSALVTQSRPVDAGKPDGVISNSVQLLRRDGVMIDLTCYNAQDEKGVSKTRPQPLLSLAQLSTMVRSKLWKAPAPYTPPTDPPKRPS